MEKSNCVDKYFSLTGVVKILKKVEGKVLKVEIRKSRLFV
jgi:hypothetical protein